MLESSLVSCDFVVVFDCVGDVVVSGLRGVAEGVTRLRLDRILVAFGFSGYGFELGFSGHFE